MILIAGRTATGKDTLAKKLEEKGLKSVKSYTTRPRRFDGEDTHIFITPEESTKITDKIATTVINSYEYFATASQIKDCDLYIIDPNGIQTLIKNCPDTEFKVIYVEADKTASKTKAVKRSKNTEESDIFEKRYMAENEQFSEFEKQIENSDEISPNCRLIYRYKNNFTKAALNAAIEQISKLI